MYISYKSYPYLFFQCNLPNCPLDRWTSEGELLNSDLNANFLTLFQILGPYLKFKYVELTYEVQGGFLEIQITHSMLKELGFGFPRNPHWTSYFKSIYLNFKPNKGSQIWNNVKKLGFKSEYNNSPSVVHLSKRFFRCILKLKWNFSLARQKGFGVGF